MKVFSLITMFTLLSYANIIRAQEINYILYDYTKTRQMEGELKSCNFGQLYAERNNSSKIKMYFSNYDYNTGTGVIYNTEGLHFINMKPDSVIYTITNAQTVDNYFKGNFITSVLPQYYFGDQQPNLSDSIYWRRPPQINWVDMQCEITYYYKDGDTQNNKTTYIFSENGSLRSIIYEYTYQGLSIKDEFSLSNIVFNVKMNKLDLYPWLLTRAQLKNEPTAKQPNAIQKPSPESVNILDNIKNASTNTSLSSVLEEKKLILLDFWYISCPPCIKSIPVINEIKNNYDKSKIDVIPVNCIDKVELIRKFVNKNKINFNDQYIAEKEVLEKLKIGSFPTFILLNNQGHELGRVEGINNLKENLVLMINLNSVR